MARKSPKSYLWIPGQGPDATALARMGKAFPRPAEPMGEAWFMGTDREMFPELFGDLETLADDRIQHALEEIASGCSSFGPLEEWVEWYGFLLPRLIQREWALTYYQPAERLFTAFMALHPAPDSPLPYQNYRTDALATLGQHIMSPRFWPDGQLDAENCLSKWTGPTGIAGWARAGNLLSASLFFCIKYLPERHVDRWFRSALAVSDRHWRVQMIAWLVGAYPLLAGDIQQPSKFGERAQFGVQWDWSHVLDGHYSGNYEEPIHRIPFLPAENCDAIVKIAREIDIELFLQHVWSDPNMKAVISEIDSAPERFLQLYGSN